jgi:hypothetical protein
MPSQDVLVRTEPMLRRSPRGPSSARSRMDGLHSPAAMMARAETPARHAGRRKRRMDIDVPPFGARYATASRRARVFGATRLRPWS